ncbi:MBL fold metallo-hydrolase [Aestuariivivens sediminis]|uniref:MBL fold metallo-hydrolase n=1 Tax=Aestuariivivens sediminis TaxID=2913557 RepID=UPI001F58511C|nr:MBL fold metallo-hydrolase [Aestuariivivens sediminis]
MGYSKLYLGYAGFCYSRENYAIANGRNQDIIFNALWGLIEHPKEGYILFDTGYTGRFYSATNNYPNKIYNQITKVHISPEQEVKAQLATSGISADSINHIFISHFHADHIGGLRDFPNAIFHASSIAVNQMQKISKSFAFTKGILKDLIPDDFMNRLSLIDKKLKVELPFLGIAYDLFADGSLKAVPLPGHAAGQMGLLLSTNRQSYFLIADACWLKESYVKGTLPSPIVRLFFDSWSDFKSSLKKVINFHKNEPQTIIIPTHCAETTDPLIRSKIDLDVL